MFNFYLSAAMEIVKFTVEGSQKCQQQQLPRFQ